MAARFIAALAAALLLASPGLWAQSQPADPPSRVGRLSAIEGNVQQRTPDDNDWVQANLNYPVTNGFSIAPQDGGRAEIQVGSMALRVGSLSVLDVTNLTDRDASLTLAQGEVSVRVGALPGAEHIEIVTPRGVMQILAPGQYHLDAGTTEDPTRFEVLAGRAAVQREDGNTDLANGQAALINPDNTLSTASAQPDPLDQWAFSRDRGSSRRTNTASAPQPSPYLSEMTGEPDLSAYGSWTSNPEYGEVWYPSGVQADWAPYTDGHWAWVSPWGWTWIDDEPWGFAPFHYGRWAFTDTGWCWVPGEVVADPIYAPALVVFIGSPEHHFFFDREREGIGWFPLGPHEAYVPGYRTSIDYVRNVNRTSVDVRNLNIARVNDAIVLNNRRGATVNDFANHRFATVVPANQFGHTQRARDVAVRDASATTATASLPVSHAPTGATPPRSAGTNAATSRPAQFNRTGRPPLPQARTATGVQPGQPGAAPGSNAPTRTIAGRSLPALPPAPGNAGAAGSHSSGRFGTSRIPASASHGLPPVPSAPTQSPSVNNRAAVNSGPASRNVRGPFGTTRPSTVTNATRQATPPAHTAPPGPAATAGHRGFASPAAPSFQRNTAAPTRSFAPSPRPQVPTHTAAPRTFAPPANSQPSVHAAAPPRNVSPPAHGFAAPSRPAPAPRIAAPVHNAPPAAPARPAGNAAVSHAPAPHPQPAPHAAPNNQKRKE